MRRIVGLIMSFCLLALGSLTLSAQNDIISGTVVDQTGEPVIGAGIVVKGAPPRIIKDYFHYICSIFDT